MAFTAEGEANRLAFLDFQIEQCFEELRMDRYAKGVRVKLGALYCKRGDHAVALNYLVDALNENENDARANYWFGFLLLKYVINPKGAVVYLERACRDGEITDSMNLLASARNFTFDPASVRFRVGDAVMCKLQSGFWMAGHVLHVLYRETGWKPQRMSVTYLVGLVDGEEHHVIHDSENAIRTMPRDRTEECAFPGLPEPEDPFRKEYLLNCEDDLHLERHRQAVRRALSQKDPSIDPKDTEDEIVHLSRNTPPVLDAGDYMLIDRLILLRHACIPHVSARTSAFYRYARTAYVRKYKETIERVSTGPLRADPKDCKTLMILGDAYFAGIGDRKERQKAKAYYIAAAMDCRTNEQYAASQAEGAALVPLGDPEAMCNYAEIRLMEIQLFRDPYTFNKETLESLWLSASADELDVLRSSTLFLSFATRQGYLTNTALIFGEFLHEHQNLVKKNKLTPFADCLIRAYEANDRLVQQERRVPRSVVDPSLPTLERFAQKDVSTFMKLAVKHEINNVPTDLHLEFRKLPFDPFQIVMFAVMLAKRSIVTAVLLPEELQLNPYSQEAFQHAWLKIAFTLHVGTENERYRPATITVIDNVRHNAFARFLRAKLKPGCGTEVRLVSPTQLVRVAGLENMRVYEVISRLEKQFVAGIARVGDTPADERQLAQVKAVLTKGEMMADANQTNIFPEAEKEKDQGNVYHKRNEYLDAKAHYTQGIELLRNTILPTSAVHELQAKLVSNRCITLLKYIQSRPYGEAIAPLNTLPRDADMVLSTSWNEEIPASLRKKLLIRKKDAEKQLSWAMLKAHRNSPEHAKLVREFTERMRQRKELDPVVPFSHTSTAPPPASSQAKDSSTNPIANPTLSNSNPPNGRTVSQVDARSAAPKSPAAKVESKKPLPKCPEPKPSAIAKATPQPKSVLEPKSGQSAVVKAESANTIGEDAAVPIGKPSKKAETKSMNRPTSPKSQTQKSAAKAVDSQESDDDMPGLESSSGSDSDYGNLRQQVAQTVRKVQRRADSDSEPPSLVSSSDSDSEDARVVSRKPPAKKKEEAKPKARPNAGSKKMNAATASNKTLKPTGRTKSNSKLAPPDTDDSDDVPALVSSSESEFEDDQAAGCALPPGMKSKGNQVLEKASPLEKLAAEDSESSDDVPDLLSSSSESDEPIDLGLDLPPSLDPRESTSATQQAKSPVKTQAKAKPVAQSKPVQKPEPEPIPSDDDMPPLTGSSDSDSDGEDHRFLPSRVKKLEPEALKAESRGSIGARRMDPSEIAARQLLEEEEKRERAARLRRKRKEKAKRKKERQRQRKWEAEQARLREADLAKEAGPKSADEEEVPETSDAKVVEVQQADVLDGISGVPRIEEPPQPVTFTPIAQQTPAFEDDETQKFCQGWALMTGEEAVKRKYVEEDEECHLCLGAYSVELAKEFVVVVSPCNHVACIKCIDTVAQGYMKRTLKRYKCLVAWCEYGLPIDLRPQVARELAHRHPLKTLTKRLPFATEEAERVIYKLLENNHYDVSAVREHLDEMFVLGVRSKLFAQSSLSSSQKQRIYEEARKPAQRLSQRLRKVREQLKEFKNSGALTPKQRALLAQRWELQEELEEANSKASDVIFQKINATGGMAVMKDGEVLQLDFHQQHVAEAVEKFDHTVAPIMPAVKKLRLVTGWGKHSESGLSVLQQGILRHVEEYYPDLRCEKMQSNKGIIVVTYAPKKVEEEVNLAMS